MVLRQLIDREFIIPAPLVGSWNDKIIGWELRDSQVFTDFLSFTTDLLVDEWTHFNKERANALVAPFRQLVEEADEFSIDLFSLNYDLIWERCFNTEMEKLVENGFSSGKWAGEFDDPNCAAKLRLSKLHGSVDWYFDESTEEVRLAGEPVEKPLIIFGSSYKMQSFDPFISLLGRFRQRLQATSLYVIVGYSFQDRYINNILIQSLGSQLARSAIIVDPFAWESSADFATKVERTQSSRSLNEMLNLKRVNPARVEVVRTSAGDFFREYLSDGASKLQAKLSAVEEGERVF